MLLLDELVEWDDERALCRVTLRDDDLFASDGRVPAVLAMEYMAQTVAAFVGERERRRRGQESGKTGTPKIGYLVAVRRLVLEVEYFEVGDTLSVEVRCILGEGSVGRFNCEVHAGDRLLASGSVTVLRPPEKETR